MLERLVLLDDGPVHGLVAVPHADREDAAEEVEVLDPLGIGEVHALAADQRQRLLVVRADAGEEVLLLQALDVIRHPWFFPSSRSRLHCPLNL